MKDKRIAKLKERIKKAESETERFRQALIEAFTMFPVDTGGYFTPEMMTKLCPEYYVLRAKDMNIVRSKN